MSPLRQSAAAAIAATVVLAVLPHAALARGGGGGHVGSMSAHGGLAGPHLVQPLATMPGSGQKSGAPPSSKTTTPTPIDLTTSQPAPQVLPEALPPSALAAPEAQQGAIAPLSPPTTTTFSGSGGTARPDLLTSQDAGGPSASEAAPSTAGGGGDTLADCMGFWDRATHMSKQEWRAACLRVQNRFAGMKH
jgi:hypothetical protein